MASILNRLSAAAYESIFRAKAHQRPPQPRPIQLGNSSRVLAFTCAGIGDTLTDSVVFKALRETFPGIHLAAVVHRRRRLLLEHHPDVTVSVPNMTSFDWLCSHHVLQPDWDETHGVEQTLRIARYVGADTAEPHLVYAVRDEEKKQLEKKLFLLGVSAKPRLILQLGGGRRAAWRDWPVVRYAELIRLVTRQLEAEIFVLGGADQKPRRRELADLFTNETRPYRDVVGQFSLAESAVLLASARALVSTDTGIMHLGFAVGTRVVALIHCNNPSHRVGPYGYGDRHRVVQLLKPAGYRTPADADMADISAETVFRQVQEIWPA